MSKLMNYSAREKKRSEEILKDYECDGQMTLSEYMERLPGQNITHDTRAISHESVDKQKRYQQITETLRLYNYPMTAKEIAVHMRNMGYIPTDERNFTSPRLTELTKEGVVEPCGKKRCAFTGKKVTAYRLLDSGK